MACRSACDHPGTHRTYGECVRASGVRIGQVDATVQRSWDGELEAYRSARAQGIQPSGTSLAQTRAALDASDRMGAPYDAGRGPL